MYRRELAAYHKMFVCQRCGHRWEAETVDRIESRKRIGQQGGRVQPKDSLVELTMYAILILCIAFGAVYLFIELRR